VIFPGLPNSYSFASWAIDLDDGSSNYQIYENVCVGTAIKIGASGDFHTVYNNIIIDPLFPVLFWMETFQNSDNFDRNIVYYSKAIGNFSVCYVGSYIYPNSTNHNLFYSSPFDNYFASYNGQIIPFPKWQSMGYDTDSIIGEDPLFENPSQNNFNVTENSPAFALGFKNFPYGTIFPVGPN